MSETELDDVETLADLTDLAREAAEDEDTVLVFIEQEDAWFAVVRVDGEDDPRIFVSDAAAAARSSYGSVLTDELIEQDGEADFDDLDDLVAELDDEDSEDGDDAEDSADTDDESPAGHGGTPVGPLGDSELLLEYGLAAKDLLALAGEGSGDALSEIAEALGCGEVLEAVR
ncbi:putative tRNA adenosine deaminase-associated protein [Kitasatospora paracochleata]|uniref:tRNA adenosine deaminase-associated protein n=1 Tax=Kitasatospora paracochleata TaxID=58354 RepID=A0ABT1J6Z7_9ACTN|nr:putative tRNA adenosine deaminase-associated protein [Kitasatospora paracochleata]